MASTYMAIYPALLTEMDIVEPAFLLWSINTEKVDKSYTKVRYGVLLLCGDES